MCLACSLGEEYLPPSPQPSGATRVRSCSCPRSMSLTSQRWGTRGKKKTPPSTAPSHEDSLSRHALSYLNGGGGSGKTTKAIELFLTRDPLVFTPTHCLTKEMRAREVKAQTYHIFFRWSGAKWTPERMGNKYIPRVIIWDEVCTVPKPILETFLELVSWCSTTLSLSAWRRPNRFSTVSGETGLLAMPRPFIHPKASRYLIRKKCGSSTTISSGQTSHIWLSQETSIQVCKHESLQERSVSDLKKRYS